MMSFKRSAIIFFTVLLIGQNKTYAQQTGEWQQYLNSHLVNVAKKNGAPPGSYVVVVSFLLDSTGKIYDVKIEKDPGYGTANEVKRVFESAPAFPMKNIYDQNNIRNKQRVNFDVK